MSTDEHSLLLAIGSNTNASDNIIKAKTYLQNLLGEDILYSSVLQTSPIDIEGPHFLNLVAESKSALPYSVLNGELKQIESKCGNTVQKRRQGIVEMDIDVLWYNEQKYHEKDWKRSYIKRLVRLLNEEKEKV
ncbi:MAG: 2-amino-4-hydroxy-6-hydroxymethyldihydropteridine diphosphokinase [Prevotella sp.]|nr:2-amino-4-hydroxy-6-hydroxymethyldihydropteridine diphosphokinase [Prevotella sp.]